MHTSRSPLARQILLSCTPSARRHYADNASKSISSVSREHKITATKDYDPSPHLKQHGKRTAFIRTWEFIKSPAHAYAIIRKVEEKYGAIQEYKFAKDYELPSEYQSSVIVVFKDPESYKRLPLEPETFHVSEPLVLDQPGGIGLDDLKELLEPRKKTDQSTLSIDEIMVNIRKGMNESPTGKTMMCKIERAHKERSTPNRLPQSGSSRQIREQVSRRFLDWGGFYELSPIDTNTPITDDELFGQSTLDHVRMRRVLRKHSEATGIPNPYEREPTSPISSNMTAKPMNNDLRQWKPLPGFEDQPSEVPSPTPQLEGSAPPSDVPVKSSS
ncbi:hypothetical protein AX16_004012 [Volvariella volvacea WC 439]|nr:hypothetical protein AX16_004012 [Volvariella volvacea WC 439]